MSARFASSQRASAHNGVCGSGLITTLHHAAIAGAAFRVIMAMGKFHGVIQPTTPTACL